MLTLTKDIVNQDFIEFMLLMVEYMEKFLLIPGRIENIVMIIDCVNLGVFNMPYGMIKSVVTTL